MTNERGSAKFDERNIAELAEMIAKSGPKLKITMEEIRKNYFKQLDERFARALRNSRRNSHKNH